MSEPHAMAQTGRPVLEWHAADRFGGVSKGGCRGMALTWSSPALKGLIARASSDTAQEMLCLRRRLPKVGNFRFGTAIKQK